jgi:hypothetical protein
MSEDALSKNVSWSDDLELYFKQTGERANALAVIHKRGEALYSYRRTYIDMPVIVISSLVGFLSVGSTSMFAGKEMESSVALGILSLFVSVLNTTGSYFGWAKRAEGHRISAIQYGKLFRFLSIELSLPREERMSPHDLLKLTKEGYDRLQEISPLVPPELIKEFSTKFKKYEDKFALPEELNGLTGIRIHTNPMYRSESFTQKTPKNPNAELSAREDLRIAVPSDRPSLHRVNHSPPVGTNGGASQ